MSQHVDKVIIAEAPKRSSGIQFLEFLPKQLEVLKHTEDKQGILYSGAFRAGKTLLLVNAAIKTCLENPGVKGMLLSQVGSQLRSVVFDLFLDELDLYQKALDDAGVNLQLAKSIIRSDGRLRVTFYNGSLVYFRPCKTKDEQRKIAGYTIDFYGLDEPVDMDENVFLQLSGRKSGTGNLDNPFGILTTNPGDELHWLYRYFYMQPIDGYVHVDTTTYDNRLLPGYSNYIKEKEQLWSSDWVRRYLNGTWGMFEGQIFKEFNPKKHVKECSELPCKYHMAGVDWGLRHLFSIIVAGVTEDNRLVIKEERTGNKKSSVELSEMIYNLHKKYKFRKVYIDPNAPDLILQTYERGVPCAEHKGQRLKAFTNNDVQFSISRLKSLFKHDYIMIDSGCSQLLKEIPSYRYEEGKEKPRKEHDDAIDGLRYVVTDFDPLHKDSWFEALSYKTNKWGL